MSSTPCYRTVKPATSACRLALLWLLSSLLAWTALSVRAHAADTDVLAECMALSGLDDDVHGCMDNYLDVMDDNIRDITAFIRLELNGAPRTAFETAQRAFETYRRENCLWYLAFSTPRREAELIAKNCLARMSLDRLAELQALLVRGEQRGKAIDGFYVFGSNRNSFRPCGSEQRFWVTGDDAAVATLQQWYLERTSAELQVMFASVSGSLDPNALTQSGHDGVLELVSVQDLRVPSDADCRLPSGSPPVSPVSADASSIATAPSVEERVGAASPAPVEPLPPVQRSNPVAAVAEESADPPVTAEPRQSASAGGEPVTAYFGAWLADCSAGAGASRCTVAVDFDSAGGGGAEQSARLSLQRRDDGRTDVSLALPADAATSVADLQWGVDGYIFGQIAGSELRIGSNGLEQRVTERRFVDDELMPLLRKGTTLHVQTRDGQRRMEATLVGLTRALGFADDFLGD